MNAPGNYPAPQGGGSLLLSFRLQDRVVLIIGSGSIAATRAFAALEADSSVVIVCKGGAMAACDELRWRAQENQLSILDWDTLPQSSSSGSDLEDSLDRLLAASTNISLVVVTDTVLNDPSRRSNSSAERIYSICRKRSIPVNITDMPNLCDFTFTSTHRFAGSESTVRSALQIGVTTNGQGCRLASRIKREIVGLLPKEVGAAVDQVGAMRVLARGAGIDCTDDGGAATPNEPVPTRNPIETEVESARRRMKWVAQVSEYWPIPRLGAMTEEDMREVLAGEHPSATLSIQSPSLHSLDRPKKGRILLVGSGPGHPSLLTVATHTTLTKLADVVLSDKLVPAAVLALIPSTVEVRIAKKFPGNAEGAQSEMMEAAIEAANRGLTVVRLKQGDPVVYGRAGEEVLYFRERGYESIVIPGVSSALAGPTFAGIPVTQRGVADSLALCTAVGRGGSEAQLPGYLRPRTLVILMGVARLGQVIATLCDEKSSERRLGPMYPGNTPIAIVERASMPDQRVVVSTLKHIVRALESSGEQRPPGIMVIGWAVLSLWATGDVSVLDEKAENDDDARVRRWLGHEDSWRVVEGLPSGWDLF
ncbi:unnamed protein product [Mycena citricolor]|uniref:precorrin-2 dehydrogenase n=1 Tax=Mycena citricolor TaxID=2018698 RepID=A0AAD2HQ58_9AGAR|nr:unnamed protein product [Mycena citricolor]CAK5280975.1 unnamed protein product [Mycena citricolor]